LAIIGRAKIEKAKQEQLAKIEIKRREAIAKLNVKYAAADKVKTSFGYIGIISLSLLYGTIILNDFFKFLQICHEIIKDYRKQRREQKEKEKIKREEIIIEMEEKVYSQDLEEKLEQIHLQLIKACAKRNAGRSINKHKTIINFEVSMCPYGHIRFFG